MYYYVISVSVLLVIALFLEIKYHEHLFSFWKERLVWCLIMLSVGISWDYYAIPREHWVFPLELPIGLGEYAALDFNYTY